MVEHFAQGHLAAVDGYTVRNGAYGFVFELLGGERVGIEGLAVLLHPVEGDALLGGGERRAPVCQVVLHEGHGAVEHAFLHFGKVYLVDGRALLECLHHGSDVEGFVALGHVLGDEGFGQRPLGVEGEVGVGGVAEHAAAVVHDLQHLLVGRQRRIGGEVHRTVGGGRAYHDDGGCQ